MKVVILAGGMGTRFGEETRLRPKPMVEIGGRPILWHIMKIYSHFGFNEFVIALGYMGSVIKEYFLNYFLHEADLTVDLREDRIEVLQQRAEPWRVTLVDTGAKTMTGGRVRRIAPFVNEETFMLTYGDGLSDVDMHKLLEFHRQAGKTATVTAVRQRSGLGVLELAEKDVVLRFLEKPANDAGWVSGGFFVFEPKIFDLLNGDGVALECEPLETLCSTSELVARRHEGFWKAMDTLRDKGELEELWNQGRAPWRIW